jgi:small-conductance mechanosensitive channel
VRYDTDLDKVRKIVKKKINQVIEADPEMGPKLMGKIKSQGVREMDDSAMIMRVKYKTRPGDQFVIRREVYRLMQESFREAGIEFAHRNVTVYIPPEVKQAMAEEDKAARQKMLQVAAAGAMAAVQADEEEKAKRAKE